MGRIKKSRARLADEAANLDPEQYRSRYARRRWCVSPPALKTALRASGLTVEQLVVLAGTTHQTWLSLIYRKSSEPLSSTLYSLWRVFRDHGVQIEMQDLMQEDIP